LFGAPQPKFNEEGWREYFNVTPAAAAAKNNHNNNPNPSFIQYGDTFNKENIHIRYLKANGSNVVHLHLHMIKPSLIYRIVYFLDYSFLNEYNKNNQSYWYSYYNSVYRINQLKNL
jgi:hypothetical protein